MNFQEALAARLEKSSTFGADSALTPEPSKPLSPDLKFGIFAAAALGLAWLLGKGEKKIGAR